MTVAVLIPFTSTCRHRLAARNYVTARYRRERPGWELVTGGTDVRGFSRTQAILAAARQATADLFVITDADVWCDDLTPAVEAVDGWAIPHRLLHRLSPQSTARVLAGDDWHGLPLSTDNRQDSRPYKGHEAATLLVITRDAFWTAPPDPRFVGWGQEDDAWATALRCLVGAPWRGEADLVHLWHPPAERTSRVVGNRHNQRLLRRYQAHRRDPEAMRALIAEVTDDCEGEAQLERRTRTPAITGGAR